MSLANGNFTGNMGMNAPIQPYGGGQGQGTFSGSPGLGLSAPTSGIASTGGAFNGSQATPINWGQGQGSGQQPNFMAQLQQMFQSNPGMFGGQSGGPTYGAMNGSGGDNGSGGNWGNASMPPWMQQGGAYGMPSTGGSDFQYQQPGNGGMMQPLGVSQPPGGGMRNQGGVNYGVQSPPYQNNYSQS